MYCNKSTSRHKNLKKKSHCKTQYIRQSQCKFLQLRNAYFIFIWKVNAVKLSLCLSRRVGVRWQTPALGGWERSTSCLSTLIQKENIPVQTYKEAGVGVGYRPVVTANGTNRHLCREPKSCAQYIALWLHSQISQLARTFITAACGNEQLSWQ
jgi:hypothetical protein